MKNLIISVGMSLFSMSALAATPRRCTNFSGTWQPLKCVGQDAAEFDKAGPVVQESCKDITIFGSKLVVDERVHSAGEGATYLATWDSNLYPAGNHLRVEASGTVEGVQWQVRETFSVDDSGRKVMVLTSTRSFGGQTEVLAKCSYAKN